VPAEREEIEPQELLDRHVFHPPMFPNGKIPFSTFFEFPSNQCESVAWRKYVEGGLPSVHRMGCERQATLRARQLANQKKPDKTYIGAAAAAAGDIELIGTCQVMASRLCMSRKRGITACTFVTIQHPAYR